MNKEITINGVVYVKKEAAYEGERLVAVIVDNCGLTYVGYSDLKADERGFTKIHNAQCVVKWYTGAHVNHLINGVHEGVQLGAPADILVTNIIQAIELPFDTMEDWKNTKVQKGELEVL